MHALILAMMIGFTPPSAAHVQTDGKAVYDLNCKKCHGVTGTPAASMKRMMKGLPVLDTETMSQRSIADVVTLIKVGKGQMKPFAGKLTDEQIGAVAEYVFTLAKTKPLVAKAPK